MYRILDFPSEVQRLHYLLDSNFAVEKLKAILITIYLYVTWFFFLESYENSSLFQILLLLLSCPVVSDSLWPHGLQNSRPPCPSPSLRVCPSSCPLHRWCNQTISSSDALFSFCLQFFPASWSFPVSQLFTSGGQSIRVSALASLFPMSIWGWFSLGLTGLISLLSKWPSRVISSTTVRKHQFFGAQLSLWSNFHICTWALEKP